MYIYDGSFQTMAAVGSADAARHIVGILQSVLSVTSVLDVGCARGTWLRAWRDSGVDDIVGVDGAYVDATRLDIPVACFQIHDLADPLAITRRFDLAQSLEVAEHLPKARAAGFVADLVALAPVVLFSAAPPGQGGEHHVNEQEPEWWRRLFAAHGYVAIDCVRPLLSRQPGIPAWYRYNLILYVHQDALDRLAPFARRFRVPDALPIPDVSPLPYRLRKRAVRILPRVVCDQLARWNARRFPTHRPPTE